MHKNHPNENFLYFVRNIPNGMFTVKAKSDINIIIIRLSLSMD